MSGEIWAAAAVVVAALIGIWKQNIQIRADVKAAEKKHTEQHGRTAEAVGRIEYKVDELKEIVVEHMEDPDAHQRN